MTFISLLIMQFFLQTPVDHQGSSPNSPSHSPSPKTPPSVGVIVALVTSGVILAAVMVALVVRCRSVLIASKRGSSNVTSDTQGTNDLALQDCQIPEDCSSSIGQSSDILRRKDQAASRESLLSCRETTDLFKHPQTAHNTQG